MNHGISLLMRGDSKNAPRCHRFLAIGSSAPGYCRSTTVGRLASDGGPAGGVASATCISHGEKVGKVGRKEEGCGNVRGERPYK